MPHDASQTGCVMISMFWMPHAASQLGCVMRYEFWMPYAAAWGIPPDDSDHMKYLETGGPAGLSHFLCVEFPSW